MENGMNQDKETKEKKFLNSTNLDNSYQNPVKDKNKVLNEINSILSNGSEKSEKNEKLNQSQESLTNSPLLNKVKKRLLMLSPSVAAGLERESTKSDFYREGDKAIGVGGFGEVWKVIHKATNKLYVIKVIDKKNIIQQKMVDQMNREIEIMYKVNHPHVVKLINHFEDDDKFYLIMLYASKGQLYQLLKKNHRFDQRTAAQFMREVLEAVRYLHSFNPPIIHRDIKPENLLLDENSRIKLADFGWSNFKSDETNRVTYCGTPEYLSPEMVRKQGHDTNVDIWSLGVLLFELLAGHAPFSGTNQEELFNNIRKLKINWPSDFPPLAKNLITKILKLNPLERITIDEILSHAWFEKNPPIKPVLTNILNDPKLLLQSHLISVLPNTMDEKINELIGKNNEPMKVSISRSRAITAQNTINNQQNHSVSPDEHKNQNNLHLLQSENEKLIKENNELKFKLEKLNLEFKSLKTENIRIKDLYGNVNLHEENLKIAEELEKYKIMNKDRLDLLSEIEEKNNEIFESKNKIKDLEAELNNINRDNSSLSEKCNEFTKVIHSQENKINELKIKLNELLKEKEDISLTYQKKLEILQNKILDSTDDKINENNSNALTKVLEMLNDSINEMQLLFKSKTSNLNDLLNERKEEINNNQSEMVHLIKQRSEAVIEVLNRMRNNLEEDINRSKMKINKDTSSKNSEMIEWLKRQVSELQPYKNKVLFLDNKTAQHEANIKLLSNKLDLSEIRVTSLEKLIKLKESQIDEGKLYAEKIEAKLSDVKDFVFKNCLDQLDEFQLQFKNY
jgi:serine/threonine protein kinase